MRRKLVRDAAKSPTATFKEQREFQHQALGLLGLFLQLKLGPLVKEGGGGL